MKDTKLPEGTQQPTNPFNELTDMALDLACRFIADRTGSCPLDLLDVQPFAKPCEAICDGQTEPYHCWRVHFLNELEKRIAAAARANKVE